MVGKDRVILPQHRMARRPRGVEVQDALVARPAEAQADVVLVLEEGAVHQHVDQAEHLVGDLTPGMAGLQQLGFVDVAGIAPDGLVGIEHPHIVQEGHQRPLVLRLEGFPAQQRKPVDVLRGQAAQDLVAHRLVKGLAVVKIPGHGVEAVGAVPPAARDKQARADAFPVGDITVFDRCVIHSRILPSGSLGVPDVVSGRQSGPASARLGSVYQPRDRKARRPRPHISRYDVLLKIMPIFAKKTGRNSAL